MISVASFLCFVVRPSSDFLREERPLEAEHEVHGGGSSLCCTLQDSCHLNFQLNQGLVTPAYLKSSLEEGKVVTSCDYSLLTSCPLGELPGTARLLMAFILFKTLPSVNIDHCYYAVPGETSACAVLLCRSLKMAL